MKEEAMSEPLNTSLTKLTFLVGLAWTPTSADFRDEWPADADLLDALRAALEGAPRDQ